MSNKSYATMEQQPTIEGLANTPLVNVARGAIPGPNPVGIEEHDDVGHLVLRGDATLLASAVAEVLELAFPDQPLTSCSRGKICIRWISPDEWLVTVPRIEISSVELSLRLAIVGHAAIVNVSGGQTIVHLTGKHALDVLMKSTCYDVHELNFPTGKVITTTLAQAQVIIRRLDSDQFELVIRRSFADYLWMWLRDAAAEFGING